MTIVAWIENGEAVDDIVSNRPIKELLSLSGLDPDANFEGFLPSLGGTVVDSDGDIRVRGLPYVWPSAVLNATGYFAIDSSEQLYWRRVQEYDAGNSGAAKTIDWLANGITQKVTMTADCTFTFTAPLAGEILVLKQVQDGTGTWTPTWPASVEWGADGEPSWSETADEVNIAVFFYDGTTYWGKAYITGGTP